MANKKQTKRGKKPARVDCTVKVPALPLTLTLQQRQDCTIPLGGEQPKKHLMTLTVAVREFSVSRSTLKRKIKNKKLKTYRQENATKNSAVLIDVVEVAKLWPRKE